MCKAMEEMRDKKEREVRLSDIKNIMETFKISIEQAMDALKISEEDREMYASMMK